MLDVGLGLAWGTRVLFWAARALCPHRWFYFCSGSIFVVFMVLFLSLAQSDRSRTPQRPRSCSFNARDDRGLSPIDALEHSVPPTRTRHPRIMNVKATAKCVRRATRGCQPPDDLARPHRATPGCQPPTTATDHSHPTKEHY